MIPALARKAANKRAAFRAALARPVLRLDPAQVKLALAEHDTLTRKSNALMAQHAEAFKRGTSEGADSRALDTAGRRLDQIAAQMESLDARAKSLRDHPQVRAVILDRERKEERRS
jgi:hypothetical protein